MRPNQGFCHFYNDYFFVFCLWLVKVVVTRTPCLSVILTDYLATVMRYRHHRSGRIKVVVKSTPCLSVIHTDNWATVMRYSHHCSGRVRQLDGGAAPAGHQSTLPERRNLRLIPMYRVSWMIVGHKHYLRSISYMSHVEARPNDL